MGKHNIPEGHRSRYGQEDGSKRTVDHTGKHRAPETTPRDDRDPNQTMVIVNGGWN